MSKRHPASSCTVWERTNASIITSTVLRLVRQV
jgi:hypothetical protein